MFEHLPAWLGRALAGRRAGMDKIVLAEAGMAGATQLMLTSPAFADGARLPERFTADGEGASPPLTWAGAPEGARLALIVEDPDAPTGQPMVHAVVVDLEGPAGRLAEGAIDRDGSHGEVGRNSSFRKGWLPPDPPNGHGEHRYVFQLFALSADAAGPGGTPGRAALVEAMRGHVLASGVLVGTYSRGEPAMVGPVGAVQPI
jgi:Raf kinase inhibitor-like YbhB/YbcL family protein